MKKKIIWIAVVLIAAAGIAGYKIKMGVQAAEVETEKVVRGSIEEYIEESGTIALEEEARIFSTAAGKIIEVLKDVGEKVKAGEVLLRLDSSDLDLQIKALEAQKLSISAKYEEAKSPAEEEINKLRAQMLSARASYEDAKRQADSSKALYEAGAISLDTYKASVTKMSAAEAELEAAKSSLSLAEKGLSENVRRQYQAQLTEIQARIDQLKAKSEEMTIKAPIDGVVMSVEVREGSMAQPGTKLLEIGGYKGLYIESNILIEDIKELKTGCKVIIEDEDLGISSMTGTVRKIYTKAESIVSDLGIEQKRVKVEIGLNGAGAVLRPGYDINVKIITGCRDNTLLIPEKAVFNYQGKATVFVNENGTAKLRAIEKGFESNELVEVLEGLKEGEEVVLSPDEKLEEGTRIK